MDNSRTYYWIGLAAGSELSLLKKAAELAEFLNKNPRIDLEDLAYTLRSRPMPGPYRLAVVCSSPGELADHLTDPARENIIIHKADQNKKRPVFMFPGQGAQYVNMGLELYRKEPVFSSWMNNCFEILRTRFNLDLERYIYPGNSVQGAPEKINATSITQPLIFILEYSLARALIKQGIRPFAMIGYSFGEYAAACLAGVFSLEDALALIVMRGKLMQETPAGVMLNVPISEEKLIPLLDDDVSLAVVNTPSCIISGSHEAIERFEQKMKKNRYLCMRITASHAGHSNLMKPACDKFYRQLIRVKLNIPRIPYISGITGNWITPEQATDPSYWCCHLTETIRFSDGIKTLSLVDGAVFLETGPGRELRVLTHRYIKNPGEQIINIMQQYQKQEVSEMRYFQEKIAWLWSRGMNISPGAFRDREQYKILGLPV